MISPIIETFTAEDIAAAREVMDHPPLHDDETLITAAQVAYQHPRDWLDTVNARLFLEYLQPLMQEHRGTFHKLGEPQS